MKLKSITFRCSPAQFARLEDAMRFASIDTRTQVLACALEEFLDFAELSSTRSMNLFELVDRVDHEGRGPAFADQA